MEAEQTHVLHQRRNKRNRSPYKATKLAELGRARCPRLSECYAATCRIAVPVPRNPQSGPLEPRTMHADRRSQQSGFSSSAIGSKTKLSGLISRVSPSPSPKTALNARGDQALPWTAALVLRAGVVYAHWGLPRGLTNLLAGATMRVTR